MDSKWMSIVSGIERLAKDFTEKTHASGNEEVRKALLKAVQKLCISLQSPGQLVEEHLFGSADNLLIKIGVDLGVFKMLAKSDEPIPLQTLVEATGAEALLRRIMRGLASIHALDETDDGRYSSSKLGDAFASPKSDAGARLFYDLVIPGMQPLPKFLASTDYQTPKDPSNLPFNMAFGPDLFFEWLPQHPQVLQNFQKWMTAQRDGYTPWLDFYPFKEQAIEGYDSGNPDGVLLVDVGGSMGQEIQEIRERYPSLPGRLVLQDLPSTISQMTATDGMETMAHDFFTLQPIEGARVYYLRNILHDWGDRKCLIILRNLVAAMRPGYSKILLNEFAIPDRNACAFSMRSDFMVMALAGAVERTESEWKKLLEATGLKIDRIWTAEPESHSIIEASMS